MYCRKQEEGIESDKQNEKLKYESSGTLIQVTRDLTDPNNDLTDPIMKLSKLNQKHHHCEKVNNPKADVQKQHEQRTQFSFGYRH